MTALLPWLAALFAGLSATGLIWSVATSLSESARAAADTYETDMTRSLESMFLFIPARRLIELGRMTALVIFFLVMLPFCRTDPLWSVPVGLCLAFALAVGAFFIPGRIVNSLRNRRRERFNLQLLEALPMMSNALRAGFSINQAFEAVAENCDAPISQEIALFIRQMHIGVSFSEALAELDTRVASEDLTLVCTAIDIARKTGGNLTEIFDSIADTIRGRLRIHRHVKTLTAQGRLQGLIIGLMPFLLGIGMAIFKPAVMIPFALSPIGVLTFAGVTALVAVGGLIIKKIVTIDV